MKKKYLILGGGFGLYGYLPALIGLKKNVITNIKYKKIIQKRPDLHEMSKKISYQKKFSTRKINSLIYARRPIDQYKYFINFKKKINLFLEKPLAPNPDNALRLLFHFRKNKIKFKVAYLFFFTEWFKYIKKGKNIKILWSFQSKTFNDENWKSNNKVGGGIINFYGIHLIAIIANLRKFKYKNSLIIRGKNDKIWQSCYSCKSKSFLLNININKKENFIIKENNKIIYRSTSPFYKKKMNKNEDPRVPIIKKYLNSNMIVNNVRIINLWRETINITKFKNI